MSKKVYAALLDNSSDAGFRAWGSTLAVNLALVGLVQTADTGQINFASVTRPAVSTAGGYQVWRFADSSLFMKVEFGSGTTQTFPQIWITVGTGSNGSGTITGQTSTRSTITWGAAPNSTLQPYYTLLCHTADAFSMVFCVDGVSGTTPMGALVVGKTVGNNGVATSTGFGVLRFASGASVYSLQSVRTVSAAATLADATLGFTEIPGIPVTSLRQDGTLQAYNCWLNVPQVAPFAWIVALVSNDLPRLGTFAVSPVVVSHTYIALPPSAGVAGMAASTASLAFIFE